MRMRVIRWMGSCQMIPGGGDGSEETITCTVGAYSWPGTIGVQSSVVEGRICLTSAQLPTCGRLRIFLHVFLFLIHRFPSFSMEESLKMNSLSKPSHQWWYTKKGQVSPHIFLFPVQSENCAPVVNPSIIYANGKLYRLWYKSPINKMKCFWIQNLNTKVEMFWQNNYQNVWQFLLKIWCWNLAKWNCGM